VSDVEPAGSRPDPGDFRCSDADREKVAEALRSATADGRIDLDELHERLERTYSAKTYRDLQPAVADLPGVDPNLPTSRSASALQHSGSSRSLERVGGKATSGSAVAVMSGTLRAGVWVLPESFSAVAVMGGVKLDLREARFEAAEVTIVAVAIMGGVLILAPSDVAVVVDGMGVMGSFEGPREAVAAEQRVKVRVTGLALMGGVEVKRRDVRPSRRQLEP